MSLFSSHFTFQITAAAFFACLTNMVGLYLSVHAVLTVCCFSSYCSFCSHSSLAVFVFLVPPQALVVLQTATTMSMMMMLSELAEPHVADTMGSVMLVPRDAMCGKGTLTKNHNYASATQPKQKHGGHMA